jgi:hypothetical protein
MKIRRFIKKRRRRAAQQQRRVADRIAYLKRSGFQIITFDDVVQLGKAQG